MSSGATLTAKLPLPLREGASVSSEARKAWGRGSRKRPLPQIPRAVALAICPLPQGEGGEDKRASSSELSLLPSAGLARASWRGPCRRRHRSEEHTSELQSRFGISYAVFCLKKN